MNQPDLAKVLLYHVVPGKVLSTDLSDGLEAPTLNGESVAFDLSSGVLVNQSNVVSADIEAGNGVIHVIDAVLVPTNFVYQAMEENTTVPKTGTVGLLPIAFASIMTLAGAGLVRYKMK